MINCYPVAGKQKSIDICRAFAQGCGGTVVTTGWRPGPSMFYGVNDSNQNAWEHALLNQHRFDFYYADNSYFDATRGTHFRICKNRLQVDPIGHPQSDLTRIPPGVRLYPWRPNPRGHIVVAEQSDDFMRRIVGYNGNWLADTLSVLVNQAPGRRRVVRTWGRDKDRLARTLHSDLEGAYCLVTWASAAAVEAVLAGIPVIVGSRQCAAYPFSNTFEDINDDLMPNPVWMPEREDWVGILADNQWTLDEIREGQAFRWLNKREQGNAATMVQDHPGD